MAEHNIGVEVYGIYRVGNCKGKIMAKNFLNAGYICFGSVTDKNFVRIKAYSAGFIIALNDGMTEKIIPLFGAVAVKRFGSCHVVNCFVEGFNNSGCQRFRDVTDTETDYLSVSFLFIVGNLLGNCLE